MSIRDTKLKVLQTELCEFVVAVLDEYRARILAATEKGMQVIISEASDRILLELTQVELDYENAV